MVLYLKAETINDDRVLRLKVIDCIKSFRCIKCKNILSDGIWAFSYDDHSDIFAVHYCKNCDVYWDVNHFDQEKGFFKFNNTSAYKLILNSVTMETDRIKLINLLGGNCDECGNSDLRLLSLHHKNNDGKFDRRINWYKKYLDDIEVAKQKLQPLCMNCHWLKTRKRTISYTIQRIVFSKRINEFVVVYWS